MAANFRFPPIVLKKSGFWPERWFAHDVAIEVDVTSSR
ncbi:hypothetical protein SFHH103_psfHH103d_502 (plasmid) [Sinorhizobium fredii HH103]|uniref:Uncharacterized protein n=1 Tax=Sinorhizobium fredii (strain USDA 257) TaxID=1185652 RepID=I3XFS8_SINF2|nr:hypothetical protein USDA257_p00150 [Sinorhizobium fredii USDA 257]CCE99026.1 hypothetical protein SFHH103_04550 [Sinorhizobium fredii HH103]CEO91709.1 hypothetical protein SFHH103_psfHH103d_502 [Sinorhizobium fredii HH103]